MLTPCLQYIPTSTEFSVVKVPTVCTVLTPIAVTSTYNMQEGEDYGTKRRNIEKKKKRERTSNTSTVPMPHVLP